MTIKLTDDGKFLLKEIDRVSKRIKRQERAVRNSRDERAALIRAAQGKAPPTAMAKLTGLDLSRIYQIFEGER